MQNGHTTRFLVLLITPGPVSITFLLLLGIRTEIQGGKLMLLGFLGRKRKSLWWRVVLLNLNFLGLKGLPNLLFGASIKTWNIKFEDFG